MKKTNKMSQEIQKENKETARKGKVLMRTLLVILILFVSRYMFCLATGRCVVGGTSAHVVHNYRQDIGLKRPPGGKITYDYLVSLYGEPNDIEYMLKDDGEYAIYVVYDSFTFRMAGDDIGEPETWKYYGAIFSDTTYKFNNNIHVGVSKEWIIWAYRHQGPVREVELGYEYYESGHTRMVEFTYDENDCVETITFWY